MSRQVASEECKSGGDDDISHGPVDKRRCTDPLCLVAFVAHVVLFWAITVSSFQEGSPFRLISPRDYSGEFCGLAVQPNASRSLEGYPNLAFSMSVTEVIDGLVQGMLCSSEGKAILAADEYAEACGSGDQSWPLDMADLTATTEMFSDPSKAKDVFSSSSLGLASPFSMLEQASQYFNPVCMETCGLNQSMATRDYVYSPPPDASWASLWEKYKEHFPNVTLKAWPYDVCPYDARYCVPYPGIEFNEGVYGMCLLSLDSDVSSLIGGTLTDVMQGLMKSSIMGSLSSSFGTEMGNIMQTWDVFCMVAVLACVVGLIFLVLLRFFVAPIVWTSLFAVFLLFLAAGFAGTVRSVQCAHEGFLEASSELGSAGTEAAIHITTSTLNSSQLGKSSLNETQLETLSLATSACTDEGGYSVESDFARRVLRIGGLVMFAFALVWAILVCCLCSRIRLAIAVNQVAVQFIGQTPEVVLVPSATAICGLVWVPFWMLSAAFLLSQVPEDQVPSGSFGTEAEAMGNATAPGACNSMSPPGFAWQEQVSCERSATGTPLCWKCAPPRYMLDERFAFSFFSFLWHNALSIALGQCIIAGAVAIWFFAPRGQKRKGAKVYTAAKYALRYHLGSLAFGSFILAVIQFLRWWMYYLQKQAKQAMARENRVVEVVLKVLSCCLWCFEKCVKFLNRNAYIQVAIRGTSFCVSAKTAFFLIAENWIRFGTVAMLGLVVQRIGVCYIMVMTAALGYVTLQALYPEVSPILPVLAYAIIGYIVARLVMCVLGLSVDTALQCFITTEQKKYRGDFVPDRLKSFVQARDLQSEAHGKLFGCCSRACCVT